MGLVGGIADSILGSPKSQNFGSSSAPGKINFTQYQPNTTDVTPQAGFKKGLTGYDPANPFANGVGAGGDPYNGLRNSAAQEAENNQSQGLDAIARRYASMGGGPSGAEIQSMTDLNRNAAGARESAIGNINAMEQSQALPYAQLQQQGEEFGTQQQLAQQQLGEQSKEFGANLQLGENQQNLDTQANNINGAIAGFQAGHSGGLLGGGGFLGTGFSL